MSAGVGFEFRPSKLIRSPSAQSPNIMRGKAPFVWPNFWRQEGPQPPPESSDKTEVTELLRRLEQLPEVERPDGVFTIFADRAKEWGPRLNALNEVTKRTEGIGHIISEMHQRFAA